MSHYDTAVCYMILTVKCTKESKAYLIIALTTKNMEFVTSMKVTGVYHIHGMCCETTDTL